MEFKKFLEELKRRKIYNVAVTYAVVAWIVSQIIIQLATTFEAPLWIAKITTVILVVGFPIAMILAWAFEMSPKGMIRTSSAMAKHNPYPSNKKKPLSGKLFVGVLVMIIIGQFAYHKYQSNKSNLRDGGNISIAILPFKYESQDPDKEYLANGAVDAIRGHLSKIEGLRVTPKTSVEQYRGTTKTVGIIGNELSVTYLLEGSFFMVGNEVVLSVNLVSTDKEDHVYSNEYKRDYSEIILVQSEVAKTVANEIKVVISPSVKQRIESVPTKDPFAYDYYLRGNESYFEANSAEQENKDWIRLLNEATSYYKSAIEKDGSFAQAYVALALVEFKRTEYDGVADEDYLNNVIALVDKALSLDPNLAEAYNVRGSYYSVLNEPDKALKDFKTALRLDPNNIESYYSLSYVFRYYELDYVKSIKVLEDIEKRISSNEDLWRLYGHYAEFYMNLDDYEMESYYLNKQNELNPDKITDIWWFYIRTKKFDDGIVYVNTHQSGNNQYRMISLAGCYFFKGDMAKALEHYEIWEKLIGEEKYDYEVSIRDSHRFGLALMALGKKEKGMEMINRQLTINKKLLELKRPDYGLIYDLAGIYSYLGQKEEAYYWIKEFNKGNGWLKYGSVHSLFPFDPLFDNIRNDPFVIDWIETGGKKLEATRREVRNYLEKGKSRQ
jgi:TolB-like protein